MRLGRCNVAVLGAIMVLGCSSDGTGPGAGTPDVAKDIPLYSGSIGLVVDARDIFKRGYRPRTAEISFAGQAAFNTVLTIDSLTDVAILIIENDSLSAAQKDAFAAGIATTIVIRDATQSELGRLEEVLSVDDANTPVPITPSRPALVPPLVLGSGALYLLQPEGYSELLTRAQSNAGYAVLPYPQTNLARQQFRFTQQPDSSYLVGHAGAADSILCLPEPPPLPPPFPASFPRLQLDSLPSTGSDNCTGGEAYLVLEQDADSLMRLKLKGTGEYVAWVNLNGLLFQHLVGGAFVPNSRDDASRFRLMSDDIDWTFSDRGTSFDQPILPPAQLYFAYTGTLTNCSSAILTETVGETSTRSITHTFTTLESVQLFTGLTTTSGIKLSASAGVKVPPLSDVKIGAEVSGEIKFTTDLTVKRDNTIEDATTTTVAVSRERQLQVPAFTAVTVADYVKTIKNVTQPFTQRSRARGAHRSNGAPLSGLEIATQLRFNQFQGVMTRVGADYVEFTIRGQVQVDQFLVGETTVREKVNACN